MKLRNLERLVDREDFRKVVHCKTDRNKGHQIEETRHCVANNSSNDPTGYRFAYGTTRQI